MKTLFFFIVIPLFVYSCSEDPNNANTGITLKTNKTSYTNNEAITFTVINYNPTTAYLASCCTSVAYYIDKDENGNWVEYSNFGMPCLALCPGIDLSVSFMETIVDSVRVNESGKFRIRTFYNLDDIQSNELLSSAFTIQ
ncbi:MAG: hypothetical protein IPJ23_16305 [Ignavibacteriales bacterium]|nr:hypothetical protein [Ignavibacteriales bacterium]